VASWKTSSAQPHGPQPLQSSPAMATPANHPNNSQVKGRSTIKMAIQHQTVHKKEAA
jgi:hypothetical protein